MSARILVVEDELDIAELIARELKKEGFTADVCAAGDAAMAAIRRQPPDLLVLDRMLPGMSGEEVCRAVRDNPQTARMLIIMVTAKADESDRIVGLELGADKYVAKPFSSKVLVAEVKALLRLTDRQQAPSARMTYGAIVVDTERHTVMAGDEDVTLTAKEFLLFQYLLQHRGRVLSRDVLLTDVWGYRYTGGTRTVDVHVRRLREKLPALGDALVTVKQFGYKLLEEPPEASPRP